ncbi:hypothetical protein BDK51DRAFT_50287 [Blyttiomyces helicus]|uniref:Uncharacterized protein n=1 Tax=Blyttiomyces helicus TaxID=388810 RepID=A0A4P9WUI4_9FUNG|nr:hypothetical protein BDK51DRAFT_50287 [Blyttiomyces helicus]|eukprot:RKO94766.1 hypothetical protein BDK51DRAFT_50287 [Blyttiomyces helicus]
MYNPNSVRVRPDGSGPYQSLTLRSGIEDRALEIKSCLNDLALDTLAPSSVIKYSNIGFLYFDAALAPDASKLEKYQHEQADDREIIETTLGKAQDEYAKHYNHGSIGVVFRTGDQVLLNTPDIDPPIRSTLPPKLTTGWVGPFTFLGPGPTPDI